ncbi:major facilitator superfamily domain-containing protein [Amylocystis lapponica]|nr:major facilitator superfamily domain-containing protein [Amylocystis lapponica]
MSEAFDHEPSVFLESGLSAVQHEPRANLLHDTRTSPDHAQDKRSPGVEPWVEGAEHILTTRPGYRRTISEQTLAGFVVDDKPQSASEFPSPAQAGPAAPDEHAATTTVAEHLYPPAAPAVPAVGTLEESTALRRLRKGASFVALFLAGWNGGATGALIPSIEEAYGIDYSHVALLFLFNFLGYVVAAGVAGTLSRKVGFGHALCIAVIVELMGNIINSSQQTSFAVMCFGFFVVGLAFSTQLGLFNAYFAILPSPLMWTGLLHGIYGLGAFASPQVATAMVTRGVPYHLFYTTNVGMNIPVFAIVWFAFRNLQVLPPQPGEVARVTEDGATPSLFLETLKSRAVWTLAIFLMLYVGAEESIGGWIVSYILEVRKGSPEGASWVASSFYLGIAIGRITLPALNLLVGERRVVFLYLLVAGALELLAWRLPFLASTALCTALVGLAISTFYTAAITAGGRLIPRSMHADAFALMSSVGQSGSAFWPLVVGIMSTKRGISVLEPTVVALLGAQGVMWWLVPKIERRVD